MTNETNCLLASRCKKAGDPESCSVLCYPWLKLHGDTGRDGILGLAQIPGAYRTSLPSSLPFRADNPEAAAIVDEYCSNVLDYVDQGIGFYFYSIPNAANPKGTGTGKTTALTAILNSYILERVVQHVKHEREIRRVPALFLKASQLQNIYGAQFRGPLDMQQEASAKYYALKKLAIEVELLGIDDLAVRDASPAFMNEVCEIIDERWSERRAILASSNVPLSDVARALDERIASRIDGMTTGVSFAGKDHRKGGPF